MKVDPIDLFLAALLMAVCSAVLFTIGITT